MIYYYMSSTLYATSAAVWNNGVKTVNYDPFESRSPKTCPGFWGKQAKYIFIQLNKGEYSLISCIMVACFTIFSSSFSSCFSQSCFVFNSTYRFHRTKVTSWLKTTLTDRYETPHRKVLRVGYTMRMQNKCRYTQDSAFTLTCAKKYAMCLHESATFSSDWSEETNSRKLSADIFSSKIFFSHYYYN